jgi:ABC-2 type transport system permease protein
MNWRRVWTIAVKEYVQFFRDRRTVAATMLMPLIQVVLYGFLSSDVRHQSTVVWDLSQTAQSRQLLQAFTNSQYFSIKYDATNMQDLVRRIEAGNAVAGIVIPPDYAKLLHQKKSPEVMVAVDASDATAARTSLSVAQAIGSSVTQGMVVKELRMNGVDVPKIGVDVRTRAWYKRFSSCRACSPSSCSSR